MNFDWLPGIKIVNKFQLNFNGEKDKNGEQFRKEIVARLSGEIVKHYKLVDDCKNIFDDYHKIYKNIKISNNSSLPNNLPSSAVVKSSNQDDINYYSLKYSIAELYRLNTSIDNMLALVTDIQISLNKVNKCIDDLLIYDKRNKYKNRSKKDMVLKKYFNKKSKNIVSLMQNNNINIDDKKLSYKEYDKIIKKCQKKLLNPKVSSKNITILLSPILVKSGKNFKTCENGYYLHDTEIFDLYDNMIDAIENTINSEKIKYSKFHKKFDSYDRIRGYLIS